MSDMSETPTPDAPDDDAPGEAAPIRVCPRSTLTPGHVQAVPLSRDEKGHPREALVLLDEGGVVRAYLNRCQHLPIPLDGGSRRYLTDDRRMLMCGTHGALFRLTDGYCTEGPCEGDSLLTLPILVSEDGWVAIGPEPDEPHDL